MTINPVRSAAIAMLLSTPEGLTVTPAEANAIRERFGLVFGKGPKDGTTATTLPKKATVPINNVRPGVAYHVVTGFDKKLANKLSGSLKTTFDTIKASGKAGMRAADIASKASMNGKTVQSAVWHLRHSNLIEGKPVS